MAYKVNPTICFGTEDITQCKSATPPALFQLPGEILQRIAKEIASGKDVQGYHDLVNGMDSVNFQRVSVLPYQLIANDRAIQTVIEGARLMRLEEARCINCYTIPTLSIGYALATVALCSALFL